MTYLPAVISAEYVTEYVVKLEFDDGTIKSVDISQWFIGPIFEPLKEISSFRKFFVDAGALAWPTGVDLSPEALYEAEDVQIAA